MISLFLSVALLRSEDSQSRVSARVVPSRQSSKHGLTPLREQAQFDFYEFYHLPGCSTWQVGMSTKIVTLSVTRPSRLFDVTEILTSQVAWVDSNLNPIWHVVKIRRVGRINMVRKSMVGSMARKSMIFGSDATSTRCWGKRLGDFGRA